jgi:hypothetical protein
VDPRELLAMKAALIQTTGTPGWAFVEKFSNTILRELEIAAMTEEDDTKAMGLRRDAKGAHKFKEALFSRVNMAKSLQEEQFIEVATD